MKKLKVGVVNAATPTPIKADGSFDKVSAKKLCKHWINIGLDGVLVLGTMGEGLLLSDEVRNRFVETALSEAGDKVTIFVSTADVSRARALERAKRYQSMGAHCIVLCLTPKVSVDKAIADVKYVADNCTTPCAYYEIPENTGTALVLNDILDILSHKNIHAFKDSSNNALLAQAVASKQYHPEGVAMLDGTEYRTAFAAMLGYDGVLHGGGVMTGKWVRKILEEAKAGRIENAVELDRQKAFFIAKIYNRFSRSLKNVAGQKYALKLLGAMDCEAVLIEQSLDDASRAIIQKAVEENKQWLV